MSSMRACPTEALAALWRRATKCDSPPHRVPTRAEQALRLNVRAPAARDGWRLGPEDFLLR